MSLSLSLVASLSLSPSLFLGYLHVACLSHSRFLSVTLSLSPPFHSYLHVAYMLRLSLCLSRCLSDITRATLYLRDAGRRWPTLAEQHAFGLA